MTRSFRDLLAWQKAVDLSVTVYTLTKTFPRPETHGLTSQLQRAAVSIASNIAEGSARTRKDFVHFISIAQGSNYEVQTQLVIARRLGYGTAAELDLTEKLSHDVGQLLYRLSESLKPKQVELDSVTTDRRSRTTENLVRTTDHGQQTTRLP